MESQEKVSCPYNANHIFSKEKLIWHINRCKDKEKVKHLFTNCQYNSFHIIHKDDKQTHELICPDKAQIKHLTQTLIRNLERCRERSRSRERQVKEEQIQVKKIQEEQQEPTLSDCQECQGILLKLKKGTENGEQSLQNYPKLVKLLNKYNSI